MAKKQTYPAGNRKTTPARKRHDRRRKAKRLGPLAAWLKTSGTTLSKLADAIGVSVQHVSNIVHGHTNPSLDVALRIAEATGGQVSVATWGVD